MIRYIKRIGLLVGLLLVALTTGRAQNGTLPSFTGREVRNLVAPIALYPDPLLAIMLPAATYPDQIIDAENRHFDNNDRAIDRQDWDISVKALAHYPNLLRKMADDPDWTASLGQAYVEKPQDVMHEVQLLRQQARANGVLQSTRQQRVYLEGNDIYIVPAQADTIYVPQYNPNVVYVEQAPNNNLNLLTFGAGLVIGAWLCYDTDWGHHRIYNHGWRGGGWIANARPHFTMDNIYLANSGHAAEVNRNVLHRRVNRSRITNYRLPATLAQRPPTPAHRPGPTTTSMRPATRPNAQRAITPQRRVPKGRVTTMPRQTVTRPKPSRKLPATSYRTGRNHAAQPLTQRRSPQYPMSTHQMPRNQRQGHQMTSQQNRPARQSTQRQPTRQPSSNRPMTGQRNRPARQSAQRQPTRQPSSNRQMSGNQRQGRPMGGPQHRSAGRNVTRSNNKNNR
jgi:hypothetical protein